jgi:alkylation response protein AidB-like acyl-CoA dehydrogenase
VLDALDAYAPELERLGDVIEASGRTPERLWLLLSELGLARLTLPETWGGYGLPLAAFLPVLERASGFHSSVRTFVHGSNGLWRPLERFGTDVQKRRWMRAGQTHVSFAFALTEAPNGAGRDQVTTATLDGGEWVVNGRKSVSFASEASLHYVIAATGAAADGSREWSCIIVPRATAGLSLAASPEGMGGRGTSHAFVTYDGCRVPAGNLLGMRGEGMDVGIRGFVDPSRLGIAASCLGVGQRAFDLACEFARKRVTFGRPIAERQAIQMQVGEVAAELYGLRSAVQAAAARFDSGQPIVTEASMCKLLGIDVVGRVTDQALRIHGGIGYTRAYRIERLYRDARSMWFEEGTAEIQKQTISRAYLGGPP